MIKLSNGHCFEFVVASGALAFDGRGWSWEWLLRWAGKLDPHLFTIVTKTILFFKKTSNDVPWRVVKCLSQDGETINPVIALLLRRDLMAGAANAVGLTGPGLTKWLERDHPTTQRFKYNVIVSITGNLVECVKMVKRLNMVGGIKGIEYNSSCPNADPIDAETVARTCYAVKEVSQHPIILKLNYAQPYLQIARAVEGVVEAIDINSVPWDMVYPGRKSPLVDYGGGGISGKIAQSFTWSMVSKLARETSTPVIGPSIWEYEDIQRLRMLGASAYHFGTIFLPYPWRPTAYVKRWIREQKQSR